MSACTAAACGLGGFGGPAPGDPSNDSVLSATPAFGGIDVTWSLPTTRPFAVSYTKLFRGLTTDFAAAIQIAEPSGGFYYDKLDSATRYYYWIQHVSVNGTAGAVIGPATAIARPVIAKVIEDLTAQIDAGLLAQSLKGRIDAIALLQNDLLKEVRDRENGDTTWAQALADVQNGVAQAHTFIANERSTRISENSALVQQIQGVATTSGNALSAAMTTLRSEATADRQAMTTRIDTVNSQLGNQISSVQTQSTTSINSLTGTVNALWTAKVDVNGLIGGFGLGNNGQQVEAGFDVDRFWIGRTGANKRKPFIIDSGVVYIDEAAINKLTFSKLRDESGSFIVENGKIKADYLRVTHLEGATGSFSGVLNGATGTFSGALAANALNAVRTLNIADEAVSLFASVELQGTGASGSMTHSFYMAHPGTYTVLVLMAAFGSAPSNATLNMRLTAHDGYNYREFNGAQAAGVLVPRMASMTMAVGAAGWYSVTVTWDSTNIGYPGPGLSATGSVFRRYK